MERFIAPRPDHSPPENLGTAELAERSIPFAASCARCARRCGRHASHDSRCSRRSWRSGSRSSGWGRSRFSPAFSRTEKPSTVPVVLAWWGAVIAGRAVRGNRELPPVRPPDACSARVDAQGARTRAPPRAGRSRSRAARHHVTWCVLTSVVTNPKHDGTRRPLLIGIVYGLMVIATTGIIGGTVLITDAGSPARQPARIPDVEYADRGGSPGRRPSVCAHAPRTGAVAGVCRGGSPAD